MAYNNDRLIHGIGYPLLTMYSIGVGGGVVGVVDPTYGALQIPFPIGCVKNIRFTPEDVQNVTAGSGQIKTERYGQRFACDMDITALDKELFQKLLAMYNMNNDINNGYEMRLWAYSYNYAGVDLMATDPDTIFWRVSFSGDFPFTYAGGTLTYKHGTQLGLIGSERIEKIPENWMA